MHKLLGKDELIFSNLDSLWWAAPVFVVILGLVIYLYALERRLTKRWVGFTLLGVRAALVAVLCLMFLEPIVASHFTEVHPTTVAVLLDDSLSMDVANDPLSDSERLRVAEALGLLPADARAIRLERRADALTAETSGLADLAVSLETLRRQVAESGLSQRQLSGRLGRIRGLTADLQNAAKTARDALA